MKGEIDDKFYCTDFAGYCTSMIRSEFCINSPCANKHRKWPTPKQFREEYGKDYPDSGAVYGCHSNIDWIVTTLKIAKKNTHYDTGIGNCTAIVCACTPWGCPSAEWRPE